MKKSRIFATVILTGLILVKTPAHAQDYVCAETNLGDFCMTLYSDLAPNTVANFLNYVNDGDYDETMIHRSVLEFIIQGGGFTYTPNLDLVPTDPPIANEFSLTSGLSNTRGTVAMAKLENNPDSATSQWFINLDNNAQNLDFTNDGYTVFAGISYGMETIDAIADLRRVSLTASLGSNFGSVPTLQDQAGITLQFPDDFVQIRRMYATNQLPALTTLDGLTMTLPVSLGDGLYQASLNLISQNPVIFRLDKSSISALEDVGQDAALFVPSTGLLTIPSVQVGTNRLENVELMLTDTKLIEFTLQDFDL